MATPSDEIALLFRLRGDATGLKTLPAEAKAVVAQLRQSFGPELAQTVSLSNKTFSDLANNLTQFVGQRIPLVGGAFVRLSEGIKSAGAISATSARAFDAAGKSIDSIATASGKTVPQVTAFLSSFVRLGSQTAKNEAAFKFFGGSVDLIGNKTAKFLPELEAASTALATAGTVATSTGATMAGIAGPIGIAIAALAAEVAVVVSLTQEIFRLAKASAEFQGRLFDLSQQTGVSVETLSALEVVARTTGGSIDGLVQSLGIFQRHLEEAQDESSKAGVTFKKLGVDTSDTETALRQTIAALARMPEGFRQTALALEIFGRGGKAFLAIAKESRGDIDEITERLKDLGLVTTEQAKLADEFNDQLVILEIQLRGLGTKAIPVLLDVLKGLSDLLRDNRDLFNVLQNTIKAFSFQFRIAFEVIKVHAEAAQSVLKTTAEFFERIKAAVEFIVGHPVSFPGFSSDTTPAAAPAAPAQTTSDTDAFTKQLENEVAARKRLQGVLNFAFAERQKQAEASIALAQREFEAGRLTREELLQATLLGNRKKAQAEIDALQVERDIKLREQALAKDDLDKKTQLSNAILAIDTQIANRRADLQKTHQDLSAKSQLEERKDLLAHQQAQLEILRKAAEEKARVIEGEIRAGVTAREDGIQQIEQLENAALLARGQLLKRELELAGVGPDRQLALDKVAALEAERTELQRSQSARRLELAQQETTEKTTLLLAESETLLQIAQVTDASRITALRALAATRVRTEEETEQAILKIQLDAIDRQDDAAKIRDTAAREEINARLRAIQEARKSLDAELTATGAIQDPTKRAEEQKRIADALKRNVNEEIVAQGQANKDRDRLDKELNSQLRINNAERLAIQSQGERDIEAGRQKDLENERRYADELIRIKQRIQDIQREAARFVIESLALRGASRNRVARAQLEFDKQDEADRHAQALQALNAQRGDIVESNRTQQEKAEALEALHRLIEAENDRHENENRLHILRMINSRAFTRAQILEQIRLDAGVEDKRHKKAVEDLKKEQEDLDKSSAIGEERLRRQKDLNLRIEEENKRHEDAKAKQKDDEKTTKEKTGPFDKLRIDMEDVKEIAADLEQSVVSTAGIIRNAFFQIADAVGSVVANYVLMGTSGPAALRKILAATLATIAQEAAINSIKMLAVGFMKLAMWDFPGAANAFISAGLWAALAGGSALAGRAVAGGLFKPEDRSDRSAGSGGSRSTDSGRRDPIDLVRNQAPQPQMVIVHLVTEEGLVVKHIERNVSNNGSLRDLIVDVAGS